MPRTENCAGLLHADGLAASIVLAQWLAVPVVNSLLYVHRSEVAA